MTPTIMKVSEEEIEWINMKIKAAKLFIGTYLPDEGENEITLAVLDRAFTLWIATIPKDLQQINEVIENVGIVFGQKIVDGLGFNWVITKDQNNIDLAVLGFPNKGDVLYYPVKTIAEGWKSKDTNYIENLYKNLEHQILTLFTWN